MVHWSWLIVALIWGTIFGMVLLNFIQRKAVPFIERKCGFSLQEDPKDRE